MKKNLSMTDRAIRIVLALAIGYLFFAGMITGVVGTVLLIIALIILVTGFLGWCGIYSLVGVSTYHKESAKPEDSGEKPSGPRPEPPQTPPTVPPMQAQ